MNKTMSTKSIFTFQIIAGALLLSLLVFGCSSSDNDKTPIPLEGLWELTKTIDLELPDEDGDPVEADPEGEGTTEGEGGTPEGAASLKNGETEESTRDLEDGTYLDLKGTTYSYFFRSEGVEQGLSSGTYLRKGSELTFIAASEDTITAEILLLSATGLKLEIAIGEKLQEWTLERIQLNTLPEEEEEDGEVPELPENNCSANHNPEAVPGSTANPYLLTLGKDTTVHLSPTSADNGYEARFYMEVKTAKPYRISISGFSSDSAFTNVLSPFRYFELSASEAYASEYHLFTPLRINEEDTTGKFADVYPVTSCLYVKLFSYVDDLSVTLRVDPLFEEEEEAADEGEEAADEGEEAGTPEA